MFSKIFMLQQMTFSVNAFLSFAEHNVPFFFCPVIDII